MPLDAGQVREAIGRIGAWRADPSRPVACVACGKPGMEIVDRSARPHAEWYALRCAACGLDATLNVPLGSPVQSLD
jgi:hypothetical protein